MPTNYTIRHDYNWHINEKETPKTCLTNHKGSILHHITPLVINSPGGGHTHTHTVSQQSVTHTCIHTHSSFTIKHISKEFVIVATTNFIQLISF